MMIRYHNDAMSQIKTCHDKQICDTTKNKYHTEDTVMRILYAPWRSMYAARIDEGKQAHLPAHSCDFCAQVKKSNDAEFFILRRFTHCFAILNKYPYNAGHLMILPFAHVASLAELPKEARTEIMQAITESISIVEKILKPEGVNMGLNIGKASGAGIPSHIHFHVLPRWAGDTNFLPTLVNTKVVSFDLREIYEKLKPEFENLKL